MGRLDGEARPAVGTEDMHPLGTRADGIEERERRIEIGRNDDWMPRCVVKRIAKPLIRAGIGWLPIRGWRNRDGPIRGRCQPRKERRRLPLERARLDALAEQ